MTTIRVITASGTKSSEVGSSHAWEGTTWRNSVDACDSDGEGRVFLDCDTDEVAEYVESQLETDERVSSYSRN